MKPIDRTGKEIKDGDIIDIHQTVNGESKFIIVNLEKLDVRYFHDARRRYEYDVKRLLDIEPIKQFIGETEIEIVNFINNQYLNELRDDNL